MHRDISELIHAGRVISRALPGGANILQVEKSIAAHSTLTVSKAEDGSSFVTVVASDATPDRWGDVIEPDGWVTDNYQRNPVFLQDHCYGVDYIVGEGRNVRVEDGKFKVDYHPGLGVNQLRTAALWEKITLGTLRAVSVGFRPRKWEKIRDDDDNLVGFRFTEQELYEVSWCAIPANPNALVSESIETDLDGEDVRAARAAEEFGQRMLARLWLARLEGAGVR